VKKLTAKHLKGACPEHIKLFRAIWPDGVRPTTKALAKARAAGLDVGWCANLLDSQALAEYHKVDSQTWAEYEKVVASAAFAEYHRVTGQALAEYEKVKGQALVKALRRMLDSEEDK
jgi:hypothetical protein